MSQRTRLAVKGTKYLSQKRDMVANITLVHILVEVVGHDALIFGNLTIEVPLQTVQEWARIHKEGFVLAFETVPFLAKEVAEWLGIGLVEP